MKNQSFKVTIVRKEGKNPITKEHFPEVEETQLINAENKVKAKDKAIASTRLSLKGQDIEVFINGELFEDPRY